MKNSEHHKNQLSLFSEGANSDIDKEFLGNLQPGEYVDAKNMHPVSINGDTSALKKIAGETSFYSNNLGSGTWVCIGTIEVNDNIVEVWADSAASSNSLIRINGVVVLQSDDFPVDANHPLQMDKNENCIGGEIFLTDDLNVPMIYNVQDLIDSVSGDPNKYFSAYNHDLYVINLATALDHPVFIQLENVGGGGGLPVGTYQYAIRYVNSAGDRTNWSELTMPIPVVRNLNYESEQYPGALTYGDDADPDSNTRYAIHLRFRVTNLFNYESIEIKRIAYNTGAGTSFKPTHYIVGRIAIQSQQVSVQEFFDPVDSNVLDALSSIEDITELAYVESCKSLRYHDKRLVLMNVTLASKQAELEFEETDDDNVAFPILANLGKLGYKDPYNHSYYKRFMGGEKFGFGIQLYDGVGSKGFATKVPGFENYQFPNRREETIDDTNLYSQKNFGSDDRQFANISGGITQTHEAFDLNDAISKEDMCSFKNILRHDGVFSGGTKSNSKLTTENWNGAETMPDCETETDGEIESHGARVLTTGNVAASYQPYHPVNDNDSDTSGHDFRINTLVSTTGSDARPYDPKGFAPNYHAMGLGITGIDNFPVWVKAFSVVRTPAAGRVVCQGLAFYNIYPSDAGKLTGIETTGSGKNTSKVTFFSSDIYHGFVSEDTIQDMIDNPLDYAVQFVSPLGFFSEVYAFDESSFLVSTLDGSIDMAVYARVGKDQHGAGATINPDPASNGFGVYQSGYNYTAYNRWRNKVDSVNGDYFVSGGNVQGSINAVKRVNDGRGGYFEITLNADLYNNGLTSGDEDYDDANVRAWHEPVYVMNIIRVGAEVRDQNIQGYRNTGAYIKIESLIGEGKGTAESDQKLILVDERWEDCIPALESTSSFAAEDRYIYVKDSAGTYKAWINVTFKTSGNVLTIHTAIQGVNGYYTALDGTRVYGMYRHKSVEQSVVSAAGLSTEDRFFEIVFDVNSTNYPAINHNYYPDEGEKIYVRYDKRTPISVFGGDTVVGESVFCPYDRQNGSRTTSTAADTTTDTDGADNEFLLKKGFPFYTYYINSRYYHINRTKGVNKIQNSSICDVELVRQMLVMFTSESRASIQYQHNSSYDNQCFPLPSYVIRPERSKTSDSLDDNNIYSFYGDDYGEDERDFWSYGGFKFLPLLNSDYSVESPIEHFSRPDFGFTEQTEFCTRVMWSLPRAINAQDSPGLKTFPVNNAFDISDDQGEIKYAYDATGGKGENLYAITNNGICLLLTKKAILSEVSATEIGTISSDTFVQAEYWLSKEIGSYAEMWRGISEGEVPGEGLTRREAIFIPSRESVFMMIDNAIMDIGRNKYYSRVFNDGLSGFDDQYRDNMTAVYDRRFQEYILYMDQCISFDFSEERDIYADGNILFTVNSSAESAPDTYYIYDNAVFTIINNTTGAITVTLPANATTGHDYFLINPGPYSILVSNGTSIIATITSGQTYRFIRGSGVWTQALISSVSVPECKNTFVYGLSKKHWFGTYDYRFDKFLSTRSGQLYGMRDGITYKLHLGTTINGSNIRGEVTTVVSQDISMEKEFVRVQVNSDNKPTAVEFFDEVDGDMQCMMSSAIQGSLFLKRYDGYENFIPRKFVSVSSDKDRLQSRLSVYKIIHNLPEDFKIISSLVQYKILK